MAFSSNLAASSAPHWSLMNFPNRQPGSNNPTNSNSHVLSSNDAVANSVDSLSVAVESSTCTTSSLDEGYVLPSELRRILNQVAHCGVCSTLSWAKRNSTSSSNTNNNTTSTTASFNAGTTTNTNGNSTRYRPKKSIKRNNNNSSFIPSPMSATTARSISSIDNTNPSDFEHFSSDGENTLSSTSSSYSKQSQSTMIPKIRYHSLREAVAHALLLVLERAYKKTGYTLSPIEIKKLSNDKQDNFQYAAYCDRKDKLLRMLLGKSYKVAIAKFTAHLRNGSTSNTRNLKRPLTTQQQQGGIPNEHPFGSSPPFTLQRVAEVLYSPFHYYSQTHKLCNALEKLLLVTSSSSAFGGSSGGEVRQRLNEEREKALLAGERGRENEVRRTKRRLSYQSPTDPNPLGLPTSPSSASASSESSMTPSIHSNHHQKLIIRGTTELQTGDGVSQANTSLSSSSMNHYPSALSQDPISTSTSTSTSTSSSTMTSASNQGNEKSKNGKSASSSLWNGTGHHLAAQNMEFNNELKDILQNGIKMKFYNLPNFTNRFIKSADDDMNQHEADTVITGNVQSQKHAPNGSKNNTHPNSSNNHQNINNKSNTSNSIDPPESIIVNPNNKPHVGSKFLSTSSYSAMIRDIATVTPLNTNGSSTSTPTTALPDPSLTVVGQQSNESMLYSTLPSTLSKIGESMTGIKERGNASSGSGTIDNHGTSSLKNHSSEGIVDKLTLATTSMATATSAAGTSLNAGIIPPTLSSLQQSESVKLEFELASINPSSSTTVGTLDLDPGPSSTSTSDSESCDDVEDYASDRSDGSSDNGYMEPFTAARVMTLNRMQQQQQRREQLLTKAMAATQSHHPNSMTSSSLYDFRPPPDSEYQSSDSIDSMMAEDSGGSDSSLSDMAD